VSRSRLEVADIFRDHGAAWRKANAGHVSLGQLKVMSAIESCRTAALGGHVARCEECAHSQISYNSCRNRHCPKCQGAAAKEWLAAREADLLPVPYYHVVFTLPAAIADIAYQNKTVIYDLLFKVSAETLTTIAADPKHLGARVGITSALHTWGSAMTHHPHAHMIVPGGGISLDGERWVACRPGFFLPVRVLSRLFRRLLLEKLIAAHKAGRLKFFGNHAALANAQGFAAYLAPLRRAEWVVYAKRPFGGPQAVLAYLSRYTHRVAIANSRLIACDRSSVTFRWKDYRAEGRDRQKVMTLAIAEFIRRFLIHVLPSGFHRIRFSIATARYRLCPSQSPDRARRQRELPKPSLSARRRQTASDEISIASDARPFHTSRGFLPWRFAYAGPRCAPPHQHGAGIRKPSQKRKSMSARSSSARHLGFSKRPARFSSSSSRNGTDPDTIAFFGVCFWIDG
jgi:hypothetical protein